MKKSRLTMVLAVALLLLVTGCVNEKQSEDAGKQETPTSQTEEVKESTNAAAKIDAVEEAKEGEKEGKKEGEKGGALSESSQAEDKEAVPTDAPSVNQNTITDAENSGEEKVEQTSSYRFKPYTIEAGEITTEDLIYMAYYLGVFESISEISLDHMVWALFNLVDCRVSRDPELMAMYAYVQDDDCYEVYEYDVEQFKKMAKDIMDIDLTEYLEHIKTLGTKDESWLRCKNGKLYKLDYSAGTSERLYSIENITKDGDIYTFYGCDYCEYLSEDLICCTKYEAVIQNGIIKSVKECGRHTDEEIKAYEEEKNREAIAVDKMDCDRLNIAYLLMEQQGDFDSVSSISKETLLPVVLRATLQYKDPYKAVGTKVYNEYKKNDEGYLYECTEEQVKQAAKMYLNLDLTQRLENDPKIKYQDGKYVVRCPFLGDSSDIGQRKKDWHIPLNDGWITDVRKNGDVYTFHTKSWTCCYLVLGKQYDFGEDHMYEVVIKNGVIVSGKRIY